MLPLPMNFLGFTSFGLASLLSLLLFAAPARAEAEGSSSPSPGARGPGLAVEPAIQLANQPYAALTFVPSYRFGKHFALAGNVTYGWGATTVSCADDGGASPPGSFGGGCDGSRYRFLRASLEPRHVFVLGSATELWLGAEVGVADAIQMPFYGDITHHAAPLLGVGTGIDLYAGRFVSLGFELHMQMIAWGNNATAGEDYGLRPAAHSGLVVGFHLPI
jgi:hypothetical protein